MQISIIMRLTVIMVIIMLTYDNGNGIETN